MQNATFYNSKLPLSVIQQLRLSFLTSQTLINKGGSAFLSDKDFSTPIDEQSERMALDFLIENFEKSLNKMQSEEVYRGRVRGE